MKYQMFFRSPAFLRCAKVLVGLGRVWDVAVMEREHGSADGKAAPSETVGEVAYRQLRADILFGRLAPSERLRLDRVSQHYGTSISTMRELLSRLSSEGLIVAEGQRGFQVAPVSADDFREVAAMRLLLEGHAIEQSFAAGDLDWEGRVVAAHHKLAVMERRMISGDRSDSELWKRCDWDYHHALVSACGSSLLLQTHAAIYDKYLRYQMVAVVFRGEIAAREHQKLLECALARDAGTARNVLFAHVQGCVDHALRDDTIAWLQPPRPMRRASAGPQALEGKANIPGPRLARRALRAGGRPDRRRGTSQKPD
jgi:DNA-binding GntR family transcriptional regulator